MNSELLLQQANMEMLGIQTHADLEAYRSKYLGKKGIVADIFAKIGTAPVDQKAAIGKTANDLRTAVTALIEDKEKTLGSSAPVKETKFINDDVTLPGSAVGMGHAHLLTQTIDEILEVFKGLGFVVAQTPELETEFHNFTGLNIPVDHKPPMAVVVPGKVYRPDAVDASHSFMFHQLEGLLVDESVKFSDLKGLLTEFCRRFFGPNVVMRFRPHFFPFTEPSAEVDIGAEILGIGKKKWLEILGCGMVNPKVFEAAGYPKGKYKGIAFGMGIERMAMLKYRINDIRYFYENDVRFLKQF